MHYMTVVSLEKSDEPKFLYKLSQALLFWNRETGFAPRHSFHKRATEWIGSC